MAFQFNQPKQPSQQGIASLPAPSSAQGGFAFQPQQAVQHPAAATPRAQPLTNHQLGVTPGQQTGNTSDAFAQSMQAWQTARQAELAGLKSTAPAVAAPQTGGYMTMGGWVSNDNPYGMGAYANRVPTVRNSLGRPNPAAPTAPTTPTFNTAPLPTDPQQYMAYVAQQQAAFEKQKAEYQAALNAYKG